MTRSLVARGRSKKEEIFGSAERAHAIHTGKEISQKNGWTGGGFRAVNAAAGDNEPSDVVAALLSLTAAA